MGGQADEKLSDLSLDELLRLREKLAAREDGRIAIVGVAFRFPGGATAFPRLWDLLSSGRCAVTGLPESRAPWFGPGAADRYRGGFLAEDVAGFDAPFFHLSPREAELIDPQHRLFLETVWHALEDSGHRPGDFARRSTGVFVGQSTHDYAELLAGQVGEAYGVLGISPSLLANRVSFLLDLTGPSQTLDTACSSSLVALHAAVSAIRAGDCEQAIVGGVNLLLAPRFFDSFREAGMLSPDGVCRTFDEGANGYVRGEGVAALVLRRLEDARRDGDPVYAVLLGSGVNHGGRAGSLTAPNPAAQAALVRSVLRRAGVAPRTVGYVEAHGTGTPLGDPIEVEALVQAFAGESGEAGPEPGFCGLGSVKGNVGHLEACAGLAGVIKVLACFRYGALVPNATFERLNPRIGLRDTPFYIVDALHPWTGPLPRRASVSSFGFGGANAYVLLEEPPQAPPPAPRPRGPRLVVLSARDGDRLRESVQRLAAYLEEAAPDLADLAYTLQAGREPMAERLALVAEDLGGLQEGLARYLRGELEGLHVGRVPRGNPPPAMLPEDVSLDRTGLARLAARWVAGAEVPWERLAPERPRRVAAPGYPFGRKRYWLPVPSPAVTGRPPAALHPLLDVQEPAPSGYRFRKSFDGTEPWLREHVVGGTPWLPAVVLLQMARAAGERAGGAPVERITGTLWARPVAVGARGGELAVTLVPGPAGLRYEIADTTDTAGAVHARGTLVLAGGEARVPPAVAVDLEAIRRRLPARRERKDLYRDFARGGLVHGPAFQAIEWLASGGGEALARISLPPGAGEAEGLAPHPGLLDGALQTVLALTAGPGGGTVPFGLDDLVLTAPWPATVYAHAAPSGSPDRFDVQVLDGEGREVALFRGLTVRRPGTAPAGEDGEIALFEEVWRPAPRPAPAGGLGEAVILVLGGDDRVIDALRAREPRARIVREAGGRPSHVLDLRGLPPAGGPEEIEQRLEAGVLGLFDLARTLRSSQVGTTVDLLYVYDGSVPGAALEGMAAGFARSLRQEDPGLRCRVADLRDGSPAAVAGMALAEWADAGSGAVEVRWDAAGRHVREIRPAGALAPSIAPAPVPENSVVLITGGLGGLGRLFARHLASGARARLVLAGRSPLTPEGEEELRGIESLDGEALYIQVDVSRAAEARRLVAAAVERFGRIDGVLHAAGVLEDALLANKNRDAFRRVLAPKVDGAIHLDRATRDQPLSFFVCFSSIAALAGHVGQTDYAAANSFLDRFAEERETLRRRGERRGLTVSVSWPWWRDGGMAPSPEALRRLARDGGMVPLGAEGGLRVFGEALRQGAPRLIALPGDSERLARWLAGGPSAGRTAESPEGTLAPAEDAGRLRERVEARLTESFVELLKVEARDLDSRSDFAEYGVDSILMMKLMSHLESAFGITVAPSVFSEHRNLESLAGYITGECQRQGVAFAEAPDRTDPSDPSDQNLREDGRIAVVALACRFPGSPSPETYWENLEAGRDLIRKAPPDRWDAGRFFDRDGAAPHKTYSKWGGFIEDVDRFDAAFFGVPEGDAVVLDPQHRILLELCQELLDRAGLRREDVAGRRIGVFVGGAESSYLKSRIGDVPDGLLQHFVVNTIQSMMAARLADFYDFRGAARTIDTACSSSLVAIHDACQALHRGEVEAAVAGGVELLLDEQVFIGFSKARVLSDDGTCYVFDRRAKGMVLAEGAGLVLLKRYESAVRDGDPILACILGSAVNNDGRTVGLTVPSPEGQKEVIAAALEDGGITPDTIGYLEAHGTGTLLGDPIEIQAAGEVYRRYGAATGSCAVGSVKSNMGHLLHAAGVASLIKVVLGLGHGVIPRTLHCEHPHERFQFERSPFRPALAREVWTPRGGPRRAAVSSFGFGGTNCHMIVEERPEGLAPGRPPLPLTRFQRKRYWLDRAGEERPAVPSSWTFSADEPFLRDHVVLGDRVLLGVTHCSAAIAAIVDGSDPRIVLRNVLFSEAIALQPGERLSLRVDLDGSGRFRSLYSTSADPAERESASGEYAPGAPAPAAALSALPRDPATTVDGRQLYARSDRVVYGPSLETVRRLFPSSQGILAELELTDGMLADGRSWAVHPALLDGAVAGALFPRIGGGADPYVPMHVRELRVHGSLPARCLAWCRVSRSNEEVVVVDLEILDEAGGRRVEIEGLTCKRVRSHASLAPRAAEPLPAVETDLRGGVEAYLLRKLRPLLPGELAAGDRSRNFLELGADSNGLVWLAREIEQEAGIQLYPTLFFEHPSLERLAAHLVGAWEDAFRALLPAAAPAARPAAPAVQTCPEPVDRGAGSHGGAVAVIGMAGSLAGSPDLDAFWRHLRDGSDLITEIPADRWDYRPWFDPDPRAVDRLYCKWGSFLDGVGRFDARFFHVSPREARMMDPQLRLLLEVFYATADDAGLTPRLRGTNTGVFVGACFHDYQQEADRAGKPVDSYDGTGNAATMLANRPSFFFDLRGPSLTVDTACSSSLVALHLACRALQSGDCDMAFVGGVNLLLSSWHYRYFCSIGALSPTGRCHTFDEAADGYVPGEAAVAVLLKPLAAALRDGDHVHAVIRGSAVRHGGHTPSITAPSTQLEAEVVAAAWEDAGIDPETLGYVEAHGTGTKLGDPVELEALVAAFRRRTAKAGFCAVGSAKAHVGHTEGAAGLVGVIKAILSLQRGRIPAMPGLRRLNPYIRLDGSALRVNREEEAWERPPGGVRRAGVSSFGFGGAYAHVVLEEAPETVPPAGSPEETGREHLVVLSARSEERLHAYAGQLRAWLERQGGAAPSLAAIAHTLRTGRESFDVRLTVVARNVNELAGRLAAVRAGEAVTGASEDLGRLARLWISGAAVDWPVPDPVPPRVSLPGYPFGGEWYWVPSKGERSPGAPEPPEPAPESRPEGEAVRFQPVWEESRPPEGPGTPLQGCLLAVAPDERLADLLLRWREAGAAPGEVVLVRPGSDPARLLRELRQRDQLPGGILHLGAGAGGAGGPEASFLSVLALARAWLAEGPKSRLPLVHAYCAGADGEPGEAAVAAFFRTLHAESDRFAGRAVEVRAAALTPDLLSTCVIPELLAANGGEEHALHVLRQGGRRWVRRLRETGASPDAVPPRMPREGVWLITGGAGALGLLFAEHLARRGAGRLALVGRSPLGGARAERLRRIETLGAAVHYFQADVAAPGEAERLVATVRERLGPVRGLLHAAGVTRDALVPNKELSSAAEVLAPKVRATLVLDEALAGEPLDSFVLCSSLAGVLGNAGQGDYAYANAFLDAFAEAREARRARGERPGRTVSIAWPLWREGGMRVPEPVLAAVESAWGLRELPSAAGLEALDHALAGGAPVQGVAWGDGARIRRRLLGAPPAAAAERPGGLLERLRGLIAREIEIPAEEIDPRVDLAEYGLDSILVTAITSRLEEELGLPMPKTLLLEHRSLRDLSEYLLASLPMDAPAPRRRPTPVEPPREEPVAVIGLAGRYPGARDLGELWTILEAGRSSIAEVPPGRWDAGAYWDPEAADPASGIYCRWGGFLEDVDKFDPVFFGITPVEAKTMPPEERLLLEVVWSALEQAGTTRAALDGDVGVWVGVGSLTYPLLGAGAWDGAGRVPLEASLFGVPNRVSHFFGFTGPSLAVDTGCSSSLVAVHMACESLRRGECSAAVAAGVNLYLHPSRYLRLCQSKLLSSRPEAGLFERGGDGFIPGEGVGAVLLKPLSRALAAGDPVWGVIRGSGVRHKGRATGFLLPSPKAQEELLAGVMEKSGTGVGSIGYVELQAPGSEMGDAAEWAALRPFTEDGLGSRACALGSLRPGLGYLEAASGVAQLTRVLLQMRHGRIAPTRLARDTNPDIPLNGGPFWVPQEPVRWSAAGGGPRRAAILSSGIGGVVASLILEEAPAAAGETGGGEPGAELVVLSGRTRADLQRVLELWRGRAAEWTGLRLADVAFTLQVGREAFKERWAAVVYAPEELLEALESSLAGRRSAVPVLTGTARPGAALLEVPGEVYGERDLGRASELWVRGAEIDWRRLGGPAARRRVPLPGYPFARRRCWMFGGNETNTGGEMEQGVVGGYYDRVSEVRESGLCGDMRLTFAPFPERVEGFSWLLAMAGVEEQRPYLDLVRARQQEMRETLFRWVDFSRIGRVLDVGCGLGHDLVDLAVRHPRLEADGYTLSARQAEMGRRLAESRGVADRVRIFRRDSARDPFPGRYGLVLGFEVLFHIEDKRAVFRNVAAHLEDEGAVLLIDCLANTVVEINMPELGQFTSTAGQYAEALADSGLRVAECVDASGPVRNFLDDPRFEEHLAELNARHPRLREAEREHRAWNNFGQALDMGLFRYVLLCLRKAREGETREDLLRESSAALSHPVPYGGAAVLTGHETGDGNGRSV